MGKLHQGVDITNARDARVLMDDRAPDSSFDQIYN